MYVIQRTDQGGGFVARPGHRSYTRKLQEARTWPTRTAAEAEKCPGNEVVLSVEQAMGGRP